MSDGSQDPFSREPLAEVARDDEPPAPIQAAPMLVEMEGEERAGAPSTSILDGGEDLMTQDEFFSLFGGLFPVVGGVIAMRYPPPLQTLMTASQLPTARPASDAIYDLAKVNAWLRWLIDKRGKWAQQAIAIGAFGAQIFAGVTTELRARAAEAVKNNPPEHAAEERPAA